MIGSIHDASDSAVLAILEDDGTWSGPEADFARLAPRQPTDWAIGEGDVSYLLEEVARFFTDRLGVVTRVVRSLATDARIHEDGPMVIH